MARAHGLCPKHYYRLRHPDFLKRREGGTITPQGYVIIVRKGHPNATTNGGVLEHRWVMADHLGRPLRDDEYVHHRNGIRNDNRLENLELWCSSQPPGQRVEDLLAWAKEILERYEPDVPKLEVPAPSSRQQIMDTNSTAV